MGPNTSGLAPGDWVTMLAAGSPVCVQVKSTYVDGCIVLGVQWGPSGTYLTYANEENDLWTRGTDDDASALLLLRRSAA